MADEMISNQFSGLDMGALIGGPLKAICESQTMLAAQTVNFIQEVGMEKVKNGDDVVYGALRNTRFSYSMPVQGAAGSDTIDTQKMELDIPLLSIVKIPTFGVDEANITFDMEVKSSTCSESSSDESASIEAGGGGKIGPFSVNVSIKGSVSAHQSNTRSTDNSAKYHVDVHAKDFGMPEGLARVMDILNASMAPKPISDKNSGGGQNGDNPSGGGTGNKTQ